MKIALAHDSLTQLGGAERVLETLHEMYPDAPVYTLVASEGLLRHFLGWNIIVSGMQRWYDKFPKFQYYFPLIPLFIKGLKVKDKDVLLSSSSSFIKNISVPQSTAHICYCHTPTRFLWIDTNYAWEELPWFLKPFYPAVWVIIQLLKTWDYNGAQRVHSFIANSRETQRRIKKYYGRDSVVVYPCINADFWKPTKQKENYFLIAGRLQPHKNNELVIKIFNELGLPLHVVGTGRQESYLRSIAKKNITFLGRVSDEQLRDEYSGAVGFVYPQLEDAGLMPLEAAACGTATLGLAQGGSLETIVPGITGELFKEYDGEIIKKMILEWDSKKYTVDNLQKHASKFNREEFKKKIEKFIEINRNT